MSEHRKTRSGEVHVVTCDVCGTLIQIGSKTKLFVPEDGTSTKFAHMECELPEMPGNLRIGVFKDVSLVQ